MNKEQKEFLKKIDVNSAKKLWLDGNQIYKIYNDGTESLIEHYTEFTESTEWLFGIQKSDLPELIKYTTCKKQGGNYEKSITII